MRIFGLTGRSGSGKTALLVKLVPWLVGQGITISTVKQAKETFDVDCPGKDSYRHREAGACEVLVASPRRWALMHEYRDEAPFGMEDLLSRMSPVDLILIEGFRDWNHERLELWRPETGREPLYPEDSRVVALAAPVDIPGLALPRFDCCDIPAIGRFILDRVGLG